MSEIPKTEAVEEVAVEQISLMPSVADIKKLTFEYAKVYKNSKPIIFCCSVYMCVNTFTKTN